LPQTGTQDSAQDIRRYQRSREAAMREPAQTNGIRNYHKELFGTDPSLTGVPSQEPARPLQLNPVKSATSSRTSKTPAEAPTSQFLSRGNSRIQQAGFSPSSAEKPIVTRRAPQVVQAEYTDTETRRLVVPVNGAQPALQILPPNLDTSLTRPAGTRPAAVEVLSAAGVTGGSVEAVPVSQPLLGAQRKLFSDFREGSPKIETEWRKRGDLNVGQSCQLELVVTNAGTATAAYMEISAEFPSSVRVTKASPTPFDDGTWKIPSLAPGKEQRITFMVTPLQRGEISPNANVKFTTATAAVFKVEEPMLAVAVAGPKQVTLGEPASHVVTISNPGTGIANDVRVIVTLPNGLEHASKRNQLMMDLGSLSPGEKRNVRLALTAIGGGEQSLVIDVKSGAELAEKSQSLVTVLAPKLEIAVKGPSIRYVGRDARYSVSVANNGAATTDNVRAMYAVPEGFEFQSATRGGKFDASRRIVSWFVGSVKSKETIEMSLKLRPVKLGEFAHAARVVSEHGDIAEAQAATRIEGTASLLLKVVDLDDPVETGKETAYEITIQNDGSKEAQNVGLSIELPVGVKLVDVKGPSAHIAESGLVVFKSLAVLPSGKSATYRIFVRGMEEGNQRLRARLTSDSIQEPLTVEELTRFYAE
jgi:uncharacterized repeat protein (TIGR01451 family)